MKIFFRKIGKLILLFVASMMALYFYGDYKKPKNPIKETTTTLFVGDSHIQKAIIDSLIKGSQSIALSAEPLKYSYYKIQQVLDQKNNINKIYLGISYHNLSKKCDDIVAGKVKNMDNSTVYFSYLPREEKIKLVDEHRGSLFSYIQNVFHQSVLNLGFNKIKSFYGDFWGGYINEHGNTSINLTKAKKRIEFYFFQAGQEMDFSSDNIFYLNKIIALCKEKKVGLILVNTPLHRYYKSGVPEKFKVKFNEIITKSGMPYVDFNQYNFSDSSFMPDGDHVSVRGAAEVTKIINEIEQNAVR